MGSNEELKYLSLIHEIVRGYERDVAQFFSQHDRALSKFSGRFHFKQFAKKFFDPIPDNELGDVYVNLLKNAHLYMNSHQKSKTGVNHIPQSFLLIPELFINMILPYQLPQQKTIIEEPSTEDIDDDKSEKDTGSSKKKRKTKKKTITIKPRVTLTDSQSLEILEQMLMVPLNYESKIWKQAKYVLCPTGSQSMFNKFGEIVAKNTNSRMISFVALTFFMRDEHIRTFLTNPSTILHALYLGPLNSHTVEAFAANRDQQFRTGCREILRVAQNAAKDQMAFEINEPQNMPRGHPDRIKYRAFAQNVAILIKDLTGEHIGDNTLHAGWACAAIKKFGYKRYVEKTWKDENFYDLIWTVLAQRPNLKKFVCDVLEKQFHDAEAARFWKRMQPAQMNKNAIRNANATIIDPLTPDDNYLDFPNYVKEIKLLSTTKEVENFENLLRKRISTEKYVYIGVDAEWSAYSNPSKATILQMALDDSVCILDLESYSISKEVYSRFLTFLFESKDLIKIGFQFGEDLHQLRAAFRNVVALYVPNNVVCVGRILMETIEEIEKNDEIRRELFPYLSFDVQNDDPNKSIDSKSNESIEEEQGNEEKKETDDNSHLKHPFLNKGLSYICEKVLGKPLDKTEQCSVWDRRPLRSLQLRYAAMDAYCMLMLFEKCRKAHDILKWNTDEYIQKQPDIRMSLPLLSEYPL